MEPKTKFYTVSFQWDMLKKALSSQKYKKYFEDIDKNTPDLALAWYLSWQYAINDLNDASTKDLARLSYYGFDGYYSRGDDAVVIRNIEEFFNLYLNWDGRMGQNLILEALIIILKFYEIPIKEKLNAKWDSLNDNNIEYLDEDN